MLVDAPVTRTPELPAEQKHGGNALGQPFGACRLSLGAASVLFQVFANRPPRRAASGIVQEPVL